MLGPFELTGANYSAAAAYLSAQNVFQSDFSPSWLRIWYRVYFISGSWGRTHFALTSRELTCGKTLCLV